MPAIERQGEIGAEPTADSEHIRCRIFVADLKPVAPPGLEPGLP